MPAFEGATVYGDEAGLDNPVRWVHISEVLDIARLLRGGELVLTTGMAWNAPPGDLRRFVGELAERGVAGLVVELGRTVFEIPEAIDQAAREVGLPVITPAREVPFVEVTEEIHSRIISQHYTLLKRAEQATQSFTRVLLGQGGVEEILRSCSQLIGAPVLLLPSDPVEPPLAFPSGLATDQARLQAVRGLPLEGVGAQGAQHFTVSLEDREEGLLVEAIYAATERWGHLVVWLDGRRADEYLPLVVDRAAVTIALELMRLRSIRENRVRLKRELVDDLYGGEFRDEEEIYRRAAAVDVPLSHRWMAAGVFILAGGHRALPVNHSAWQMAETNVRVALKGAGLSAVTSLRESRILFVAAHQDLETLRGRLNAALEGIVRQLGTHAPAVEATSGVGQYTRHPRELARSFREADFTARLRAQPGGGGRSSHFSELGVFRLFFDLDPETLGQLVEQELGPILRHDRQQGSQLAPTLRLTLDCDFNMAEAAKRLGTNRQTLYNRLERIRTILGHDPSEAERQLVLGVAFRILDWLAVVRQD